MENINDFKEMPPHLRSEAHNLVAENISSWHKLKYITDEEISFLVKTRCCSRRNLIFLKGLANLICHIKITQSQASLLIHSGISSVNVLAKMTPDELVKKTSRLERQLNTNRRPYIDLKQAKSWISTAKKEANRKVASSLTQKKFLESEYKKVMN